MLPAPSRQQSLTKANPREQAMVSPLVRRPAATTGARAAAALLSASPLIIIGGVRLVGTRAADYHEHASE